MHLSLGRSLVLPHRRSPSFDGRRTAFLLGTETRRLLHHFAVEFLVSGSSALLLGGGSGCSRGCSLDQDFSSFQFARSKVFPPFPGQISARSVY